MSIYILERFFMGNNLLLMIPGPIQPEAEVLEAMGGPVQAHYGPDWTRTYNHTTSLLKQVFNTQGDVHLMVGSGSTGLDACLGSALSSGEKVLIGYNGFFGERLKSIAEGFNLDVILVPAEWGQQLRSQDFEDALRRHPDAKLAAVVHLETSTTIVNPVEEIGAVTHRYGVPLMVDAVSSLGGLPVQMDDWHIDLCASASQKCLGAPPGLSPVAVSPRGWELIDRNPNKGHGWYTNLRTWRQYAVEWADWHPFPISLAVNNVMALKASLESLLREGVENRMQRYQRLALQLRAGLRAIGYQPYTSDEQMAPVLTAAFGPAGVPTSRIVTYMAEHQRIKIAGGLGALKDKIIRIGHMSPAVSETEIDAVTTGLAEFQHSLVETYQ
jgi:alanine-glyoxylate transaminase/serine-glyoxylate transaminase/serine-pyruvate transaminase